MEAILKGNMIAHEVIERKQVVGVVIFKFWHTKICLYISILKFLLQSFWVSLVQPDVIGIKCMLTSQSITFSGHTNNENANQLQKHHLRYSHVVFETLLHMNKHQVPNSSSSCFLENANFNSPAIVFTPIRPGSLFFPSSDTRVFIFDSVWGLRAGTAAVLSWPFKWSSEGVSALLKGILTLSVEIRASLRRPHSLNVDLTEHDIQTAIRAYILHHFCWQFICECSVRPH